MNNKGADQTARMCMLVCAFVVYVQLHVNQVFSRTAQIVHAQIRHGPDNPLTFMKLNQAGVIIIISL